MENDVFTRRYKGPSSKDQTAPYYVNLKRKATVKEFIEAVLSGDAEWGNITIRTENQGQASEKANISFSDGRTRTSDETEKYMDCIVTHATAVGGWSRMDYMLTIESEES